MKRLLIACTFALSMGVHAASNSQGPHGGIAAARGIAASRASQSMATTQSGHGGPSHSVVDDYQPWPESEMRVFEKKDWTPYKGD